MANQQSAKGNPAHTRMSNADLKARRAASWKRGQERKAERVKRQVERQRKNRAAGLTAWQVEKENRRNRRFENKQMKRNDFGHIVKVIGSGDDVHTVVICDHPKNYTHKVLKG